MFKVHPKDNHKSIHEQLSWKIREKELEISHILRETLFWKDKVNPELAKKILKKEEFLSSWFESQKNRQAKVLSLKEIENNLRDTLRAIQIKKALMKDYYQKIGYLALQDYREMPAKWEAYKNIFYPAVSALEPFTNKVNQNSNPFHFFLAANFSKNPKVGRSFKNIYRSIGEKVMQLNLVNFTGKEGENSSFLSEAEYHEQEYSKLLKKKRNLEVSRRNLYQDLAPQISWLSFLKNILFSKNQREGRSPKAVMLELEGFYTQILKDYLENSSEKIPASMKKALAELENLKSQKINIEQLMISDKAQQKLKVLNHEKLITQKKLKQLEARLQSQKDRLREIDTEENEIKLLLERIDGREQKHALSALTQKRHATTMGGDKTS